MTPDNNVYRDEISLVDLATIFMRRIWLFICLMVLFIAGAIVFAVFKDEQFEYVSLYQLAEEGADKPVEKAEKVIAILNSQKVIEAETRYKAEHGVRMPFTFNFTNPEDTGLLRISTEATRESARVVENYHSELLDYLKARHATMLESVKNRLEVRIEAAENALEELRGTPDSGQAVADVMQNKIELESDLSELSTGQVLVVARESLERVAPNRKLIVVLGTVIGFIVAFIAVFFAEFASLVRKAMQEQRV